MGLLVDGAWKDTWYETASSGGRFIRSESQFRDVITGDGGQYPAEPDRYHLYVAMACPWAHRALIMRALKGPENFVSVSVVPWLMLDKGWPFEAGPGVIQVTVHGIRSLYDPYSLDNTKHT